MPSTEQLFAWALSNSAWSLAVKFAVLAGVARVLNWVWGKTLDWRRELAFWGAAMVLIIVASGIVVSSQRAAVTPDFALSLDRAFAYRLSFGARSRIVLVVNVDNRGGASSIDEWGLRVVLLGTTPLRADPQPLLGKLLVPPDDGKGVAQAVFCEADSLGEKTYAKPIQHTPVRGVLIFDLDKVKAEDIRHPTTSLIINYRDRAGTHEFEAHWPGVKTGGYLPGLTGCNHD